jgi:HEAT repeat protein
MGVLDAPVAPDVEITVLIEQVKSPDAGTRLHACREIAWHWQGRSTNLENCAFRPQLSGALTGAVSDPEQEVRLAAAMAMVRTVGDAPVLVPVFVGWLQNGDAKDRAGAAWYLALLGVEADGAIEALQAVLEDELPVRAVSAYALYRQGQPSDMLVPILVGALGNEDAFSRWWAAELLAYMGVDAAEAGPALAERLCTDKDASARSYAATALPAVGADASMAVPALIQGLSDDDEWVREQSATSLRDYGRMAEPAAPYLVSTLMDENRHVALRAADALKGIGPSAADVAPSLLAGVVNETDSLLKSRVLRALAAIVPHNETLLALLVDELNEDSWFAADVLSEIGAPAVPALAEAVPRSRPAVSALGDIGPAAKEAVPVLLDVLPGKKGDALEEVVAALGKIGPAARQAIPVLTSFTDSRERSIREEACVALARITGGKQGIDLLVSDLSNDEADVRSEAALRLSACGPLAAPAVDRLVRLLADEDDEFYGPRMSATVALGAIGHAANSASPRLRNLLEEEGPVNRARAAEALVRIGDIEAGLQYLKGSLRDRDPVSRMWAAQCLRSLGALAAPALPELRRATNDRFAWVNTDILYARWEIEAALRRQPEENDGGD